MFKLVGVLIIIGIIIGGISYAVISDPDFDAQRLYEATLKEFANQSAQQERQFQLSQNMKPAMKQFSVSFSESNNDSNNSDHQGAYLLKMTVNNKNITLLYEGEKGLLVGQTIILEPVIKDNSVRWKCINGSVLARVRTKNCRLGYGHSNAEMSAL